MRGGSRTTAIQKFWFYFQTSQVLKPTSEITVQLSDPPRVRVSLPRLPRPTPHYTRVRSSAVTVRAVSLSPHVQLLVSLSWSAPFHCQCRIHRRLIQQRVHMRLPARWFTTPQPRRQPGCPIPTGGEAGVPMAAQAADAACSGPCSGHRLAACPLSCQRFARRHSPRRPTQVA